MAMVEVKTGDLIGPALDWVMATIEELPIKHDPMGFVTGANAGYWVWDESPKGVMLKIGVAGKSGYSPSTDWNRLGPLIMKFPIIIGNHESGEGDGKFWGSAHCFLSGTSFDTCHGVMVAACRAIAALKRGAVVPVPKELIQ